MAANLSKTLSALATLYAVKERTDNFRRQRWRASGYLLAAFCIGAGLVFFLLACHTWLQLQFGPLGAYATMAAALLLPGLIIVLVMALADPKPRADQDPLSPEHLKEFIDNLDDEVVDTVEQAIDSHPLISLVVAAGLGALISRQLRL
jgi:hypothetical protein